MEKDFLEYENLGLDLQSLAILVTCLSDEKVTLSGDENIKDNCYTLISDMILDRAELADELFKKI